MSPVIQRPEVGLRLAQRYGIESIDSILAPEIVPVVLVDDITRESAADRLECMGYVLGSGADNTWIGYATRQSSATIHRLELYTSATAVIEIRVAADNPADDFSGFAVQTTKAFLDRQVAGVPELHQGFKNLAGTTVGTLVKRIAVPALTMMTIPLEMYLPGNPIKKHRNANALYVVSATVNIIFVCNATWSQHK